MLRYVPFSKLDSKQAILWTVATVVQIWVIDYVVRNTRDTTDTTNKSVDNVINNFAANSVCNRCVKSDVNEPFDPLDVSVNNAQINSKQSEQQINQSSNQSSNQPSNQISNQPSNQISNQPSNQPYTSSGTGMCKIVCDAPKPTPQFDEFQRKRNTGMFYDEWDFYDRHNSGDLIDDSALNPYELQEQIDRLKKRKETLEERATSTAGYDSSYQHPPIKGDLDDELHYSDYNHLPVGAGYKSKEYEYGYSFIPPEKWYPQPPRPPICVAEGKNRSMLTPVLTDGSPADLKEFHTSRRFTGPLRMNSNYVNDKMNSQNN